MAQNNFDSSEKTEQMSNGASSEDYCDIRPGNPILKNFTNESVNMSPGGSQSTVLHP